MDRLQSMRVFSKVVEHGGFAKAGEAMDLSNAVITRHVADLEEHLGAKLLNRTTRRLSLTDTGLAYLERVRQILQDIEAADGIANADAHIPSGTLRIFSHPGFGQQQLAQLLPRYAKLYPKVTLDLTLSERPVDLTEEGFDVGIFIDTLQFQAGMVTRQLAAAEVLLCASPSYVKTHGVPRRPEDISQHACLNFSYDQIRHHWPINGPENSTVQVPITAKVVSNNGHLLRECALAGMGILIRTSYILGEDIRSGRLVRLLPHHHLGKLAVVMAYPGQRLLSPKVRSFVDFMGASFPRPETDPWLSASA
jgi:DNA-binding transcriptional LysR family regulator